MKVEFGSVFDRSLDSAFRDELVAASKGGWWRDVLADESLLVALRGSYLNVYWLGQSIFKVWSGGSNLCASTHEKYLLDPRLKRQVAFDGRTFAIERLVQHGFLSEYGPGALDRLKRAARLYTGKEKAGCHWVALANPNTIDVEVAFSATIESDEEGESGRIKSPRIDLLLLEPHGEDAARLVFWEAKAFSNPELGSPGSELDPAVLGQMERYRAVIAGARPALEASYARVCADLHALHVGVGRSLHPLIEEVALGKRSVTVGDKPLVNLLVFGFDMAQREAWRDHVKSLGKAVAHSGGRLRAVGDPKNAKLRASAS